MLKQPIVMLPNSERQEGILSSLRTLFGQLVGVDPSEIDVGVSFLELGTDSLQLLQASQAIRNKFGVEVPFRRLLEELTTLAALAAYIDQELPPDARPDGAPARDDRAGPDLTPPPLSPPPALTPHADALEHPPSNGDGETLAPDAIERIVAHQLRIMSEQLELLRNSPLSKDTALSLKSASPAPAGGNGASVHTVADLAKTNGHRDVDNSARPFEPEPSKIEPEPFIPYQPIRKEYGSALSPAQVKYLEGFIARYTKRTQASKRQAQAHRPHLADNRASAGFRLLTKELVYTLMAERSLGSKFWDIDGNEYIDLTMGFGVHLFGHSPSFILETLREQFDQGIQLGPQSYRAGPVAERLCELTGTERVTFCNSGTEAIMTALRLARTVTRRARVALFVGSYHGSFDGVLARGLTADGQRRSSPMAPGTPPGMVEDVWVLDYARPESLEFLRAHAHELAAVLVEPVQSRRPDLQPKAFLQELRRLTEQTGTALIFDEIVTGFRIHPGGAQAWFGVQADLVTYGKVVGGGLPIGIIAGKAAYMDAIDGGPWDYGDGSYPEARQTFFAGTFCKHPLTMAAAWAVLNHLKDGGPELQQRLNQRTSHLTETLNAYFEENQVPIRIGRFGSLFRFLYPAKLQSLDLLFYHLIEKGVYIWEGRTCFLSTAHTEEDIHRTIAAVKDSVGEMREAGFLSELSPESHVMAKPMARAYDRGFGNGSDAFSALAAESSSATSAAKGADSPAKDLNMIPVTEPQRELWIQTQIGEDASVAYNESLTLHLRGTFRLAAMRQAVQEVVNRHEALRTTFSKDGEYQRIHAAMTVDVPLVDFSHLNEQEREAPWAAWLAGEVRQAFDLEQGPLLRVRAVRFEEQYHLLIITAHHIIFDGWSSGIFLHEICALYSAECQGIPCPLPQPKALCPAEPSEGGGPQDPDLTVAEAYWLKQFAGPIPVLDLPTDRPRPARKTYNGALQRATVDAPLSHALKRLGAGQDATLFMTLLASFNVLLHRLSGQCDLVVGILSAGRSFGDDRHLFTYSTNLLPLLSRTEGDPRFIDYLASVKRGLLDAYDYNYPFSRLVQKLNVPWDSSRSPLVSVIFNMDRPGRLKLFDLDADLVVNPTGSAKFDLFLNVIDRDGQFQLDWNYNTDLFDGHTVRRWTENFQRLLASIVADPEQRLSELRLWTEADQKELLTQPVRDRRDYSGGQCLHAQFEAQVERTPDAIAVICEDRQLTYGELDRRSNRLAHRLRALGVGPEVRVAVGMEHSPELVVGLLGILKAGGAYVMLDAAYPKGRLAFMLQDVAAAVLITERSLERVFGDIRPSSNTGIQVVCLDSEWEALAQESAECPINQTRPENLAYITYASGQGVMAEHRSISSRIEWLQREFRLGRSDAVLNHSPLTLDRTAVEMFWPLLCGGRLVIASPGRRDDPAHWWEVIRQTGVSVAYFVPSALSELLQFCQARAVAPLDTLRGVLTGGEPLRRPVAEEFFRHFRCGLYNLYAPSEAASEATMHACQAGDVREVLPIGLPAQTATYVLDKRLQPVPVGVAGELYLGGEELARGHIHDPSETAEWFLPNPFSNVPGGRLFKTCDAARGLSDGTLALVDRDEQAWVRGFRVRLAEVEAAVLGDESTQDGAVLIRETERGCTELVAYVVPSGPFSSERLQSHVTEVLPVALRPSAFVPVFALPVTREGTVDRAALRGLPVIDENLMRRWEDRLRSVPEIEDVAVVAREQAERYPPLHRSDLIPNWKSGLAVEQPVAASTHHTMESNEPEPSRMAISDGGPLVIEEDAPRTLVDALLRTVAAQPDKGILYVQPDGSEVFQSYPALLEEAKCLLTGLHKMGLKPYDKVILQVEELSDYFPALWACILGGITPVTIAVAPSYQEKNSVVSKLYNTWELLGRPPILASDRLNEPLTGLSRFLPMPGVRIGSIRALRRHPPSTFIHQSCPEEVAFFQLTSGSTGVPKCIQETHRGIISHIHASKQFNHFRSEDVSLNWLPVDHVVPILTYHLKDVYLGCRQIQVPTNMVLAEPLRWLDLIEAHRVTHTWSPNFGYKLVSDGLSKAQNRTWDLSSIKFLMNAGEQVTLPVVRDFLRLVAPFRVLTHTMQPAFGMAEVCTCMTYQNRFDFEAGIHHFEKSSLGGRLRRTDREDAASITFVDLGPPVPGVEIRIVDKDNQLLPEGVIGRLQIKGDVVTPGYFNNPSANQEAFLEDGWFNSGDLGFIVDGRLTLTGREKEMIIVHGANYYCYEIEDIVNRIDGVKPTYAAACAVDDPGAGTEGLAIFFTPAREGVEERMRLVKTIRAAVASSLGVSPSYVIPVAEADFPKTTSGKIQRAQLKKQLADGHFQPVVKESDIYLENANTLPDWFYRRIWRRKESVSLVPPAKIDRPLLFLDRSGLGEFLCTKLEQRAGPCVRVEAGQDFIKHNSYRYRLDPKDPGHYQRLLRSLTEEGIAPTQFLHLWTYGASGREVDSLEALAHAQDQGVYGLLFLIQTLAEVYGPRHPARLLVVSSYAQPTAPADRVAYEKAPILGLIRTVSQELPWLDGCHIDLAPDRAERNASYILKEMAVVPADREVAYRNGRRLVPRIEKIDFLREKKQALPFKPGGMYLLSGGLGGIGMEVARYLLSHYGARLLLVGRTPLPEPGAWEAHLERRDAASEKIKAYLALTRLEGDVAYEAADICDLTRLRQAVDRAKSRWGCELDGVIHLAGVLRECPLVEETRVSFDATLRSKVSGTWTLYQLLKDQPQGLFVMFSSLNGCFGGAMAGAYAAANSFLDGFVHHLRYNSPLRSYCLSWSLWDGVGMARNHALKRLSQARGYRAITAEQGLCSFLAGLHHDQPHLLVGLDGGNSHVRRHTEESVAGVQRLSAYFTSKGGAAPLARMQDLVVKDRFQQASACEFLQVQEIPRTAGGAIDQTKLADITGARRIVIDYVAPRSDLERQVADVWQEVLGVARIGIHDNFFELGGNSLLATQALVRLRRAFQLELSLRLLLEQPTVAKFSAWVEATLLEEIEGLSEEEAERLLNSES